ncbi:fibrinogen beta and gamma chain, globular domain protein, partial [Necator americanus]
NGNSNYHSTFQKVTVFRRISGSVYFYNRTWNEYESGFGDMNGSFWLGLAKINRLAPRLGDSWTLRIEIRGDFCSGLGCLNQKNGSWWAEWPFKLDRSDLAALQLGDASTGYVLELGPATAGNLTTPGSSGFMEKFNSGHKFTTIDKDNDDVQDVNCAQFRNFGGWWHGGCGYVALNGLYKDTAPTLRYMVYTYSDGHKKYFLHPMKSVMMIRPGSSH